MAAILYVDSDPERAEVVCALFEQKGHRVHLERSGERALLSIQQGRTFDVLVLSLFLHGMDGGELCRCVERLEGLGAMPKVAFTAPGRPLACSWTDGLPHWLPIDWFANELEDPAVLVEAVAEVLKH